MIFGLSTIALLIMNVFLIYFVFHQRKRRAGEPPLIHHKLPFIGCALEFGRNPLGFLTQLRQKHGDIFTVNMSGWTVHFLVNPLDIKCFEKSNILDHSSVLHDFADRVVGQPHAFDATGEKNPRGPALLSAMARGLKAPLNLSNLTEACASISSSSIQKTLQSDLDSEESATIGLYEFLRKVIFDTTFHMFFGFDELDQTRDFTKGPFYEEFTYYFEQSALLVDRIPVNLLPSVKKSRNRLIDFMKDLDLSKRVGVSQMIEEVGIIGKDHPEEMAHHFLIILWAAQANALPAVFWIIYHLLQNPFALNEVMMECENILSEKRENNQENETSSSAIFDQNEIRKLDRSDLSRMVVFDACIKESLRIAGSSMVVRKAKSDGVITISSGENYLVRKGDYAMFYSEVTHMDSEIFEFAEQYNYERHIASNEILSKYKRKTSGDSGIGISDEEEENVSDFKIQSRRRYSCRKRSLNSSSTILTFGCGGSRCPGRHIAVNEMKFIILHLFKYFDIRICDPNQKTPAYDMKHLGFGVMPPMSDVKVTVSHFLK